MTGARVTALWEQMNRTARPGHRREVEDTLTALAGGDERRLEMVAIGRRYTLLMRFQAA
jgi:hypothetical protein